MDFQTKTDISLNYLLNILHQKEITILGHDNVDIDAALSGILLSKLLDFLGIKNQFQIFGPIKEDETYTIIRDLIGVDLRTFEVSNEQESEEANLFLVDHYETTHKGTVIGYIDHHPTIKEPQASFHFSKNSSATAFLIYQFMQQYNYPINKQDALMIVTAMMADTVCFKSSKAVPDEINIAQQLATTYNLDWNLIKKYTLCLTPIDKMSVSEIISNGEKQYNYNGSKVFSSYVQL